MNNTFTIWFRQQRIVRAKRGLQFLYSSEEKTMTGMIVAIEIGKINAIGVVLQEFATRF